MDRPVADKRKAAARPVTQEAIAEAGLRIVREEGPDALSLRRVAEATGTNHVMVYRRCGGFDGLLDICADHIAADFPLIPDDVDWATATEIRFNAVYDMWAAHVDLIVLMRGRAWLGVNMETRFYEPALRSMLDAGLTRPQVAQFFAILDWLTMGSVLANRANPWGPSESREAIERIGPELLPSVAAVQAVVDRFDIVQVYREALRTMIDTYGALYFRQNATGVGDD